MPPPLYEAAPGSRLTSVPAESQLNKAPESDTSKLLPHSDPTFYEVARRLDWGEGDWTLRGPAFEDGTYPIIHIEWRLGEVIFKLLQKWSRVTLSRRQREALSKGEPLKRIRFIHKNTPDAGSNANPNRIEGRTENTNR